MARSSRNRNSLENLKRIDSSDIDALSKSLIQQSGNSDVDILIEFDTTPIAFAMLCSMLATNQMSDKEFEFAVQKLEELTNKKRLQFEDDNDIPEPKIYNERRSRRRY
jgi:hypothetical protein